MADSTCAFCKLETTRVIASNAGAVLVRDAYPVSTGHTLIVARRHLRSIFDAQGAELRDLWLLVERGRALLDQEFAPAGYNIGVNDGAAAGQTVPHLHIHLIPRYPGDVIDPRGGIRWLFPNRAVYWETDQ